MSLIYKILPQRDWDEACAKGRFDGSPVDVQDGFIHFSTAAQAQETAAKHFRGQADLVVVAFETDELGEALKWEPSRGGDLFPHLYGVLPLTAVRWARPLPLGGDGRHVFPELKS